jgi:IS5 family transposase
MQGQQRTQLSFGDLDAARHVSPEHFLVKVNELVDWQPFVPVLGSLYSHTGRPSHPPLVMFKMLLLGQWYGLSDVEVEDACRDRLSFMRFLGVGLGDPIPDQSVLVRFRQRLLADRAARMLFDRVLEQLAAKGMLIRRGTLIDATIVQSARKPPSKGGKDSSDHEAGWTVKRGETTHGYKAHVAADEESGIVREAILTPANVHDSQVADDLIQFDEQAVYADKAYDSEARRQLLKDHGIADGILHKGRRNRPLTDAQVQVNKANSAIRSGIEKWFGDWKERRGYRRCRYLGLEMNQLHLTLLAMAHNLRRMVVLSTA